MSEFSFFQSVYKVAEQLKGSQLTESERQQIVQYFKASQKIKSVDKAQEAIEKVIGKNVKILKEFASVSLDSVDILLTQMRQEADKLDDGK